MRPRVLSPRVARAHVARAPPLTIATARVHADVITTVAESAFHGKCTSSSVPTGIILVKTRLVILLAIYQEPVTAAEAITVSGPYAVCPTANDVFSDLVGLKIGPGWRRRVTEAIGGRHGCTHITELMGTVGTIAYQTRYGEDARRTRAPVGKTGLETAAARGDKRASALANSCVAYAIND